MTYNEPSAELRTIKTVVSSWATTMEDISNMARATLDVTMSHVSKDNHLQILVLTKLKLIFYHVGCGFLPST